MSLIGVEHIEKGDSPAMKLNRSALFVALLAGFSATMLHSQAIGTFTCDSVKMNVSYYDVTVGPSKSFVTLHVALNQFNNLLPLVGSSLKSCTLDIKQISYTLQGVTLAKLDASGGGSNPSGAQTVKYAQAIFQVGNVNVNAGDNSDDAGTSAGWNRVMNNPDSTQVTIGGAGSSAAGSTSGATPDGWNQAKSASDVRPTTIN